jgi:hypothetical protein
MNGEGLGLGLINMFKIEEREEGNIRILIKSAIVKELTGLLEVEMKGL